MVILGKIFENGCGFPEPKDYITDSNLSLYKVIRTFRTIQTGDNRGNYIYGECVALDWPKGDIETFPAKFEGYEDV